MDEIKKTKKNKFEIVTFGFTLALIMIIFALVEKGQIKLSEKGYLSQYIQLDSSN